MEEGEVADIRTGPAPAAGVVFLTKQQREALKARRQLEKERESLKAEDELKSRKRQLLETSARPQTPAAAPPAVSEELEQLKNQYLGVNTNRRKLQKPSEKFRNVFQFDWDAEDDTMQGECNPLYTERYTPHILFGRGLQAGFDPRQQRQQHQFYDELASQRRLLERNPGVEDLSELAVTKVMRGVAAGRSRPTGDERDADESMDEYALLNKPLNEMTDRDWRILREDFNVVIKGRRIPPHMMRSWAESGLAPQLLAGVEAAGYETPTAIQMQAIPIALIKGDMIAVAETGSGKTAAFMLPMLNHINDLPRLTDDSAQLGPYGLVLAPARELALQIRDEAAKFGNFIKGIQIVAIVGGRNAEAQAHQLRLGADVVIGTPGRLKDCIDRSFTVLVQCQFLVLDEADRMITPSFEDIVRWLLDQMPTEGRITHMFSATMPAPLERLAKQYLSDPYMIQIGNPGEGKKSIEQIVEFVIDSKKMARLLEISRKHLRDRSGVYNGSSTGIMVFVNLKVTADQISRTLNQSGFRATSLHSGKAQEQRENALEQFRNGDVEILVATDVLGRGIDIDDVMLVVNYDMPADIETYTHRIGRTGRAGKDGKAISFLIDEDAHLFYDIKQLLIATENDVPRALSDHPQSMIRPTDSKKPSLPPSIQHLTN